LIALVLVSSAVAGVTQITAQAGGPGHQVVNAKTHGYPNAVPPILRAARPSDLAEIRRGEAQERKKLSYRLPASARYSNADMNVFASLSYGAA
jgi:hypothetical protein